MTGVQTCALPISTEFSLSRFHQISSELAEEESPKLSTFLSMFNEITNLFHCLGSALSFATSDVTTKLNHLQNRTKEMMMSGLITSSYEEVIIEEIMKAEKAKNWHLSGPEGVDHKGRDYQCASRSIVRLIWFLDFVYEMVWYMREEPNESLQTAVRYAYNKVLSPRHNALIRNAFKVAVIIVPSKATFIEKISNGHTPQEVDDYWITCENNMKTISNKFWTFFKAEGMDDLPSSVS